MSCRDYEHENAWKGTNPERLDLLRFGSDKKRFHFSIAIQGCFGGTKVDSTLLDNVLIPYQWSEYLCHVGCFLYMHSVTHSRLIVGEKCKRRNTNSISHRPGSHERCARGRTPRRVKATNGTLQEQVESDPGCNMLD